MTSKNLTLRRLICGLLLLSMMAALFCACGDQGNTEQPAVTTEPPVTEPPLPPKTGENAMEVVQAGLKDQLVTDPHTALDRDSNMTQLEALYANLEVATGDMHHHTWYSDGYNTFAEVKASADKLRYDFFACSEHNNWKQLDEELWAPDRNLYSMEYTTNKGHLNIYVPNKEALQKVQEFTYHDPDRNKDYVMKFDQIPDMPVITPRYWGQGFMQTFSNSLKDGTTFYAQLVDYIHSLGGFIQICHPYFPGYLYTPIDDENGNIDYFGFDAIEIFNATEFNNAGGIEYNARAYEYWQHLLNKGEKVYATTGSDTHYLFEGESITHLNTTQMNSQGFFDSITSGNFSLSNRTDGLRIRMSIGDTMMGGTTTYEEGKTLCVRIDMVKSYGPYRVNIYTDKGIAYSQVYTKDDVEIEIPIEDRLYYRVEIVKNGAKVTSTSNQKDYPFYLAFSNPIFLSGAQ